MFHHINLLNRYQNMFPMNCTGKLHLLTNAKTLEQKVWVDLYLTSIEVVMLAAEWNSHIKLLWKFPQCSWKTLPQGHLLRVFASLLKICSVDR